MVLQNVADDENMGLLELGNLGLSSSSDISWLTNFGWLSHSPSVFFSDMGMVNPDSTVVPIKEHNTSEVIAKYLGILCVFLYSGLCVLKLVSLSICANITVS